MPDLYTLEERPDGIRILNNERGRVMCQCNDYIHALIVLGALNNTALAKKYAAGPVSASQ